MESNLLDNFINWIYLNHWSSSTSIDLFTNSDTCPELDSLSNISNLQKGIIIVIANKI